MPEKELCRLRPEGKMAIPRIRVVTIPDLTYIFPGSDENRQARSVFPNSWNEGCAGIFLNFPSSYKGTGGFETKKERATSGIFVYWREFLAFYR